MLHDRPNSEILQELDECVYGHYEAKKTLISLVNRSKIRHFQKWGEIIHKEHLVSTAKCLLIGGSGTGKTYLMQSLAEIVDFPLLIIDATKFNPTGASGGIKADTLRHMITKKAGEYAESGDGRYFSVEGIIDQMVVFVDEFDKISGHYEGSSGNWNEHLQTNFLTLFENHQELSGVSWVFAGAFSGISDKDAKKKSVGFKSQDNEEPIKTEIDDEDIIKYGMLPEIVGRLTSICQLDTLTQKDFYNILTKKILPKKMIELSYFGVRDFNISEERLQEIAENATNSSQGVRYLQREVDKYFLDDEFNYEYTRYE